MIGIDEIIIENLMYNDEYANKVMPYLEREYFDETKHSIVFDLITNHYDKYKVPPTRDELIVSLNNVKGISQRDYQDSKEFASTLVRKSSSPSIDWLIENTEIFCRDRKMYMIIAEAAGYLDTPGCASNMADVPERLKQAMGLTFHVSLGMDYTDFEGRWDRMQQAILDKIPFSLGILNEITEGGMDEVGLNVVVGVAGGGKSAFMLDTGAVAFLKGKNVVYFSMELQEHNIGLRADARLSNLAIGDVKRLDKQKYVEMMQRISKSSSGTFTVKEYPTSSAGVNEFRSFLNELRIKKGIKADLIIVDYVNICKSARYAAGSNVNSYTLIKAICEELRALSHEFKAPVLTGTQITRDGVDSENVSMKDISESMGLAHTADFIIALMRTEELDKMNRVIARQLKNRYSDLGRLARFVLGFDRPRMKFYEVEENQSAESPAKLSDAIQSDSNDEALWNSTATTLSRRKKINSNEFKV